MTATDTDVEGLVKRLSENQCRLLKQLADGDHIWAGMGSIRLSLANQPVSIIDAAVLGQMGFTERDLSARRFVKHRITELGRAALRARAGQ